MLANARVFLTVISMESKTTLFMALPLSPYAHVARSPVVCTLNIDGAGEGGGPAAAPSLETVATSSGEVQMCCMACVANTSGLRLMSVSKSTPDRNISHKTAWIGSTAVYDVKCQLSLWLNASRDSR